MSALLSPLYLSLKARLTGVPGTKLTYTHTSEAGEVRRGVRPEDELLASANRDKKRNTETFKPCHDPTELRLMFSAGVAR